MTVKGYLLLTAACFGALAWLASNGHGYLAGGVGVLWYVVISIKTGGFSEAKGRFNLFRTDCSNNSCLRVSRGSADRIQASLDSPGNIAQPLRDAALRHEHRRKQGTLQNRKNYL